MAMRVNSAQVHHLFVMKRTYCKYDRLLLKWASPSMQQDEVLGYVVRYYDTEPRWPVKNEKEVKLASRLLKPSEQTAQFLEGSAAMSVAKTDGEMG
ncbi:unnamed protein product, partial [Symbiodinium sp. CCMP2456]